MTVHCIRYDRSKRWNKEMSTHVRQRFQHVRLSSAGQLARFVETLGHTLEVSPRDCSVLVEVNPVEVRLHLALPEVRHLRWLSMLRLQLTQQLSSVRPLVLRPAPLHNFPVPPASPSDDAPGTRPA